MKKTKKCHLAHWNEDNIINAEVPGLMRIWNHSGKHTMKPTTKVFVTTSCRACPGIAHYQWQLNLPCAPYNHPLAVRSQNVDLPALKSCGSIPGESNACKLTSRKERSPQSEPFCRAMALAAVTSPEERLESKTTANSRKVWSLRSHKKVTCRKI